MTDKIPSFGEAMNAAPKLDRNGKGNDLPKNPPRILTVKQLLDQSAERALSRAERRKCATGVAKLDFLTGGLRPGHVWVLGADTSWGKSSFAIMLADVNMAQRKRVLIVSSEDDESLYGDRLMSRRAQVSARRLRDRELNVDEMRSVADIAAQALPEPVFLDARGKAAEIVAEQVRWTIDEHEIDLVIYDYLQEFRSAHRHQDRRNEVAEVAARLREPVKTKGKTGIILSQITVTEGKKYPDKHSIRESRDVSNAAEVILLGFTPSKAINNASGKTVVDAGCKCVLVDKAKDGLTGAVPMSWVPEYACFEEIKAPENGYSDADVEYLGAIADNYGDDG